jgi:hypothetical protein
MRYFAPLLIWLLAFAQHLSFGQTNDPSPADAGPTATVSSASPSPAIDTHSEATRPFTREEKMQLATKVLATPPKALAASRGAQKEMPQRRKVLSVTVPADTEALPRKKGRRIARVVVFDYTEGKASGLLVDAASAEVLAEEPIRGRPQASEEEKQDAIKIIRKDPELHRLLQANAIFEGGFIVDGPRGASPKHRFLQVQLLTPDRLHLQRTITVDLTAGTVANSKAGE